VHNANLLVAEFLVRVGRETGRDDWQDAGTRAGRYALNEQNEDGSIYYWGRVQDHFVSRSVDHYHSGFEIRCLHSLAQLTGRADFKEATARYYDFYGAHLVERSDGVVAPKMTPQSLYPVNIHSCAEALILNATLAPTIPEARALVEPLLEWVVAHMQTRDGSFRYMISRVMGWNVRANIPYLRWGQAWMMLALSQCVLLAADRGASAAGTVS
jgi:rhamnogalacturonyl hydrolase YesR